MRLIAIPLWVTLLLVNSTALVLAAPAYADGADGAGKSHKRTKHAPTAPVLSTREFAVKADSGWVVAPVEAQSNSLVFSKDLVVEGAAWVRLRFADVVLSGDSTTGTAAYVRIVGVQDGVEQLMTAEQVQQWGGMSAYFNGPALRLEVWAAPGTPPSHVSVNAIITDADAGSALPSPLDLCQLLDQRIPSTDPRIGRLVTPSVCTAWIVSDTNGGMLTAGHCWPRSTSVVQFNVPYSTVLGAIVNPPPEDQYAVDAASAQSESGANPTSGDDFSYFGVFANTNTGLMPRQAYGQSFALSATVPAPTGQQVRVTGYGSVVLPVLPTWNYIQKTDIGAYTEKAGTALRYLADTTGGNSGAPVVIEGTFQAIGIHFYAACASGGNYATSMELPSLQAALASPKGICRTGAGSALGNLYAIGDIANNFGIADETTGNFAQVAQVGSKWNGLANDPLTNTFFASTSAGALYRISSSGAATLLGSITGTTAAMGDLACSPGKNLLYAAAPATGQIYSISTQSLLASPIFTPLGGNIGGLEYDYVRTRLWAIDDAAGGGSRLMWIDPISGVRTFVGSPGLGLALTSCRALSWDAATGGLFTISANNLYSLNPNTGVAALIGPTNAQFTSALGMSASNPPPASTCAADYDHNGEVNTVDLLLYLHDYFASPPLMSCDVDGNGEVNTVDLLLFLSSYFSMCN